MSPQSKYWGDVSPLSHMDRRPCCSAMGFRHRAIWSFNLFLPHWTGQTETQTYTAWN